MKVPITCPCGAVKMYERGHVNRSLRMGRGLFCSRACYGKSRQTTAEEKTARQREYQRKYRAEHPTPNSYWAAYYAAHRDDQLAAATRWYEGNKEHVAKRGRRWRAERFFGPYAEAYLVWLELNREIARLLPDKYERLKARGCYARYNETKKERRRREHVYRESHP